MIISNRIILLASRSPRRKELLERAGIAFEICPSGIDESYERSQFSSAAEIAMDLACRKARAVAALRPGEIILAADTLVETDKSVILGQPVDRADSKRMVELLSGRWHSVHTAVSVERKAIVLKEVDTARVRFRSLSAEEIEEYVESGEGDDKAGAYAYQGLGERLIERVEGDPETVIGLPMRIVREMLMKI